jgi:hypothetical protein
MKATLEFNLDDSDDEFAYMRCIKAKGMSLVLWEFDQYLRGKGKYHDDPMAIKHREEFMTLLENHNIKLDELLN